MKLGIQVANKQSMTLEQENDISWIVAHLCLVSRPVNLFSISSFSFIFIEKGFFFASFIEFCVGVSFRLGVL